MVSPITQPTLPVARAPSPIALSPPSTSLTPTVPHQATGEPSPSAAQALPSPTLQRVSPNHGPISGGEPITLVGLGFSEGQGLLVRFGIDTVLVGTVFTNPYNLTCTLPKSDSEGCVSVTLHCQGRSEIPNENDVEFTYEGAEKGLSVCDQLCSCVVLTSPLQQFSLLPATSAPATRKLYI